MLNAQNLSVGEMDSARLVVAGHLVILQVEAAVHVVDAVRDLVLVRHHAQVERLRSYIQYQLQDLQIQLGQLRLNPLRLG